MDSTQEQKETRRLAGKWTALFLGLSALTVWAGVLLQFYVSTQVLGQGHVAGYVKYISFFTTLGNILAALSLSTLCIPLNIRVWKFFSRTTVRSAVAVYIIVVAVAYSVLLRHLWNPEGIQYVADFFRSERNLALEKYSGLASFSAGLFYLHFNSRSLFSSLSLSVFRRRPPRLPGGVNQCARTPDSFCCVGLHGCFC
jgi:hypothetical protein